METTPIKTDCVQIFPPPVGIRVGKMIIFAFYYVETRFIASSMMNNMESTFDLCH